MCREAAKNFRRQFMNGNRLRRVLSMALCALMLLTSFPAGVLGEGEGAPAPAVTTDEGQNIPGGV